MACKQFTYSQESIEFSEFNAKAVICRIPMIWEDGVIEMQTIWRIHINIDEMGEMQGI